MSFFNFVLLFGVLFCLMVTCNKLYFLVISVNFCDFLQFSGLSWRKAVFSFALFMGVEAWVVSTKTLFFLGLLIYVGTVLVLVPF